jgi:hypothetical protein
MSVSPPFTWTWMQPQIPLCGEFIAPALPLHRVRCDCELLLHGRLLLWSFRAFYFYYYFYLFSEWDRVRWLHY